MRFSVITPTHDPRWLGDCLRSLLAQQDAPPWEWILSPNTDEALAAATTIATAHPDRVRVEPNMEPPSRNVGGIKKRAFSSATGDILVELDHDDMLLPTALSLVAREFEKGADFVYSDTVDFPAESGCTYHNPVARAAWERDGWKFGTYGATTAYPISWEPSAMSLSTIHYAPNHVRAWNRNFYQRIGGHADLSICDDHELLIRTYLNGTMRRIPEPLYMYRVHGANTWLDRNDAIQEKTAELKDEYLHRLVERECELAGAPCYDLCGGIDSPGKPWLSVDQFDADVISDLSGRWPFETGTVGAFRAVDALEHLPNKLLTMSEIYRCLRPGGWLLSQTPSATGPGAFQDPTHVSYWVENSFRYYTEQRLARYIRNTEQRFMAARLFTTSGDIPYVIADLVSLKGDDGRLPGRRLI